MPERQDLDFAHPQHVRCARMCTNQHRAFLMTVSTTMTIRVAHETKQKLERIAADTRRR